jgi:hypothetical protein
MGNPARTLAAFELRDKSFDLALAVVDYDRALGETPPGPNSDALRVQMRDLAKQLLLRIAREGVIATG